MNTWFPGAIHSSIRRDRREESTQSLLLYACLHTYLVTTYLIWKLRCERVIQHEGDPEKYHTSVEIAHRWSAAINTRLTLDRQMTQYGLSKRALRKKTVMSTWCKVLEDEDNLAEDWLKAKEVLVSSVDQEVLLNMDIDESHTAE